MIGASASTLAPGSWSFRFEVSAPEPSLVWLVALGLLPLARRRD